MIYQGEIVYVIKCQLVLSWNGSKGGLRGLKTPQRFRRGVSDPDLRATIIYLLLEIVNVLNVTDKC